MLLVRANRETLNRILNNSRSSDKSQWSLQLSATFSCRDSSKVLVSGIMEIKMVATEAGLISGHPIKR